MAEKPDPQDITIIFAGRSGAGKSTLINKLVDNKKEVLNQ